MEITRRMFMGAGGLAAATALASCTSPRGQTVVYQGQERKPAANALWGADASAAALYGEKLDEPYPLPAIPYRKVPPKYHRQMVSDPTGQPPGTLVVDTGGHFLYYTYGDGRAMRYGVGLGRDGFAWSGRGVIQYKRRWPKWTPPVEMVARQPELADRLGLEGFMPPGIDNPLGARALYIFQNGEDTLFRVHGSPEWWTIGKNVSSGCVRMINQDICDLFDRVSNKTPIVVTNLSGRMETAQLSEDIDQPIEQPRPRRRRRRFYEDEGGLGDDVLEGPVY